MTSRKWKHRRRAWWRVAVWCACLGWLAPGYGAGGIGGTGITAFGGIQGFGSIFVNGAEYHLRGARLFVDGVEAPAAALRRGQVVLVSARARGARLQSVSVHVRHALQGRVTRVSAHTVQVMGESIDMPRGFLVRDAGTARPWTALRAGDVIRVSALAAGARALYPLRVTRLYRAGHAPRHYPVMIRATLQAVQPGWIQLNGVRFRVAQPVAAGRVGSAVLARGVMRSGHITLTEVRPDALRLGPPGTVVEMSGYVTRATHEWRSNGVAVRFRTHPPVHRMLFINGVVDAHERLLVRSYRISVPPMPSRPEPRRPAGALPRPEGHSGGHVEVDRPEVERPFIGGPGLSRPEVERPETGH